MGGKVVGQACAVLLGLDFHSGKGGAFWLRLDDARRLLVDVEQVVDSTVAGLQGKLAHRYSAAGVQVDGVGVLHRPSCLLKQPVYVYAGLLLRAHINSSVALLSRTTLTFVSLCAHWSAMLL